MLPMGLSAADDVPYRKLLASSYEMKTVVHLTDLEHRIINDISHLLVDGYVDAEEVEAEEDTEDLLAEVGIQQTCQLTLLDPARILGMDSRSPSDAAIYMDRMIRVWVSVREPVLGWVDCPVFTGRITKPDRDGVIVQIEAQSKEEMLLGNSNANRPFSGRKVDAARSILTTFGEDPKYIDFPNETAKLPAAILFKRETRPWTQVWHLARSMSLTAFYDGRGVARMMPKSQVPVWTLDGTMVTTVPGIGYDTSKFKNGVRVRGKATAGSKSMIDLTEYLTADNPNSRQRLGRRGKVFDQIEFLFPSDLRNAAEGLKLAKTTLADLSATVVEASFECHPIWPLEIGDMILADTDELYGLIRVSKWRKPLACDSQMQIGYSTPVVKSNAAQIRRP